VGHRDTRMGVEVVEPAVAVGGEPFRRRRTAPKASSAIKSRPVFAHPGISQSCRCRAGATVRGAI